MQLSPNKSVSSKTVNPIMREGARGGRKVEKREESTMLKTIRGTV